MVIQRELPFPLWGLDTPGATVTATLLGTGYRGVADASGRFNISLPAQPVTTTPTAITLSSSAGGPNVTLADVVFGDVFLISGQSNAELSVLSTVNYTAVLAAAAAYGPLLRLFQVDMVDAYANGEEPPIFGVATLHRPDLASCSRGGLPPPLSRLVTPSPLPPNP